MSVTESHVIRNAGAVITEDEAFPDAAEDVKQSIHRITASPFIPIKDSIRGFVFDVATGKLTEVAA